MGGPLHGEKKKIKVINVVIEVVIVVVIDTVIEEMREDLIGTYAHCQW